MTAASSPVWINGALRPADHALHAEDRGALLADAAFETILVRGGRPLFWTDHLARLRAGLAVLGHDLDRADPLIDAARAGLPQLLAARGVDGAPAALRLTVMRGPAPRGLAPAVDSAPSVMMAVSPAPPGHQAPLRLCVFRDAPQIRSPFSGFKYAGGYGVNLLARAHAARDGFDDALLLNDAGRLVSASAANLFLIDADGAVATPPISDGALRGVTRARMIAAMPDIEEKSLRPEDMDNRAIVLTNALTGPIRAVGERSCAPSARQRAVMDKMADWWRASCEAAEAGERP